MQFASFKFILAFLPLQIVAYYLLNRINAKLGKASLILGSAFFYLSFGKTIALVLFFSCLMNYAFAIGIKKFPLRKLFLAIPLVLNVFLLLIFKYSIFFISNINLWFTCEIPFIEVIQPVGLSFFTFQQISYVVSVHRGEVSTSILDYLTYILYFPKILMGPLMEPGDFFTQINDEKLKRIDRDNMAYGIKLFSYGMFKKMLLADTFARAVAWGYGNADAATSMDWLLITLFYTFEIYFDFSGYSDMATGTSLMLNITLPINFDSPYKALSIRDFWKRWHISLTRFFTKYVYIPLGGNRKGNLFIVVNMMIVFAVSGMWHGANWTFILWGVLHGAFSVIDRFLKREEKAALKPLRRFVTFAIVSFLWLLFACGSVSQWLEIIRKICLFQSPAVSDGLIEVFVLPEAVLIGKWIPILAVMFENIREIYLVAFLIGSFVLCLIPENNYRNMKKISVKSMVAASVGFVWAFLYIGGEQIFVYFNF